MSFSKIHGFKNPILKLNEFNLMEPVKPMLTEPLQICMFLKIFSETPQPILLKKISYV